MSLQISCSASTVSSRRCTCCSSSGWSSPSTWSSGSAFSWRAEKEHEPPPYKGVTFVPFKWLFFVFLDLYVLACDSFSCFLIVLNLKRPSLSLSEGLFLMEQGALAGAGQGTGFRGDVEGNLEGGGGFKIYNFTCCLIVFVCLFVFYIKTLPTCTACCCPLEPLCPSDPSHLLWRGSWETFSGVAPSAAWWHQGQSCCCCRAADEASPQQQRQWSRRCSAESSGGASWEAYQPEITESPHSTERKHRVQTHYYAIKCVLGDETDITLKLAVGPG